MDKKFFWNAAGMGGFVLGMVSIIFFVVNGLTSKLPGMAAGIVTAVLWLAKFAGCILLLQLFMKKFAGSVSGVSNADTFKFGVAVAATSSLLYSAAYLGYVLFINPELFQAAIDTALSQYSSMIDKASMDAIDEMLPQLPSMTFFMNLIWCFMYGTVLSAILSRNIPSRNPFNDNTNE